MKLIDKDAVLAEIEELSSAIKEKLEANNGDSFWKAQYLICERLKAKIEVLKVKEVDLDTEADSYWAEITSDVRNSIYYNDYYKIAKHFFELGLKAQKGEKV